MVADAAYAGKELRALPAQVTWTTRLRVDAALYDLAPPRTGRRGRPRSKGARLSSLTALAAQVSFARPAEIIHRYAARWSIEVMI
ncbi:MULTISPECIES: transposase, partial [unclassified Frankia]|uniref:transposase n=1 Tax=unclassified Frankia TaxID=2632575 RepID=UPI002AD37827